MSSLFFVIRKNLKNLLLDALHHPSKLIMIIFFVIMFLFTTLSKVIFPADPTEAIKDIAPIAYLYVGLFALTTLFTVLGVVGGITKGGSFFKMSDVNFIFNAPISTRKILVYGLIRSLGTTFLLSFFILFYTPMLQDVFDLSGMQIFGVLLCYLFCLFVSQIVTVVIYSFTSGSDIAQRVIKYGCYVVILAVAVATYLIAKSMDGGVNFLNLATALTNNVMGFFPLSGFVIALYKAVIEANIANIILFAVLNVALFGGLLVAFFKARPDFFEDVLAATESAHAVISAQKEGKANVPTRKNIKVGDKDKGITNGYGGSVFFFKHLKESSRSSFVPFIDIFSIIIIAVTIGMGYFIPVEDDMTPLFPLIMSVSISCYIMFFTQATGPWGKELMASNIYLVPEKPYKKILGAMSYSIVKPVIDGAIAFIGFYLVTKMSPIDCLFGFLTYLSYAVMFTGINLLGHRFIGHALNKGIILFVYMMVTLLLIAPGIVGTILLLIMEMPFVIAQLPIIIWNLIVFTIALIVCSATFNSIEIG